ncbi:hypothetical protein GCM10029964_049260 [Kibdelosporangium lantanae]
MVAAVMREAPMSQYFEVGEETLWNPSNGPGILFARTARAMESIAGVPCGIGVGRWGPGDPDCHSIDLPVFTAFTDALVRRYRTSNHVILRSLLEGFLATAIVMVRRGGGTVAAPVEPDRLARLVMEHSAAMPT